VASKKENFPKIFYGWWIVFGLFICAMTTGNRRFTAFTAFFNPIVQEFGWSYSRLSSLAASLRGAEPDCFRLFWVFLVDRWSTKWILFIGTIANWIGINANSAWFLLSPNSFGAWVVHCGWVPVAVVPSVVNRRSITGSGSELGKSNWVS